MTGLAALAATLLALCGTPPPGPTVTAGVAAGLHDATTAIQETQR